MRILTEMVDRMLSAVVPEITAGACCSMNGQHYKSFCSCPCGKYQRQKNCIIDCACHGICGACYNTSTNCPPCKP